MKTSPRIGDRPLPTPRQIYEYLDRFVIGQERAKRTVAIGAYNHLKRCHQKTPGGKRLIKKSNILLMGPTGSGKTHIARTLADFLEVPFTIADATEYTEAGYYGKDVEVMVGELLHRADQDIEATQRGIVFIDEVDKVARRSHGARTGAGSRDIGGEGVQQSLLKILEGEKLFVPLNVTSHWNKYDYVEIDIANILFICAGSFSDIEENSDTKPIGFFGEGEARAKEVTTEELVRYGFLPELLGRLPVHVALDRLTARDLVTILTEPREAMIPEYQRLCALDQIQLEFTSDALVAIAEAALRQKLGARALRAILEKVLHPVLFVGPERAGERVVIEPEDVRRAIA
jgi:ATP-dependent Clp protease ATP-binding subunit ClpX